MKKIYLNWPSAGKRNAAGWMAALIVWMFCAAVQNVWGQEGFAVSGVVVDAAGEPLAGVNIVQKGTTVGTITDLDGRFSLQASKRNAVLTASYIGFVPQDVTASQSELRIVLKEDLQNLDEVVVIGYGTAKKRDLTGAISTVRTEKLAVEAPRTVQDLLRANSAGVSTTLSMNAKGDATLQIRGKNTLKANAEPLLVLDGVIYEGDLTDINPMDIESLDILKDASSAAVYGAKSANGVVVINTKRGKTGKPMINFNANVGFVRAADVPKIYDEVSILDWRYDYATGKRTDEYLAQYPEMFRDPRKLQGVSQLEWYNYDQATPVASVTEEQLLTSYLSRLEFKSPEIANYLKGRFTNWQDEILRTGVQQDYTASISNRTDNMSYYWSLGYADREGMISGDTYSTFRSRLNLESKLTSWLTVGMNTNFSQRDESGIPALWESMRRITPFGANDFGNPEIDSFYIMYPTGDPEAPSPFFENSYIDRKKMYTTLNSNVFARITLPFGFEWQTNFIPRWQFYEFYNHESSQNFLWESKGGEALRETEKIFSWQVDNILRWKREFAGKHNVEVTLLANAEQYQSWKQKMSSKMFVPSDILGYHRMQAGTIPLNESDDQYQTGDALMGRLFYSFENRYMLTASVRRDGYSAFGQMHPRATFPAVALGWVFTSERFMEPLAETLSYGKLRLSWGANGNRSIGRYDALSDMTSGAHPYIDATGNTYISTQLYVNRMSNRSLQWESTASYNLGLDFALFGDKLSGTLEVYKSQTNDLLVDRVLPDITGFSNVASNLGQLDNKGLEVTLNATPVRLNALAWNTSVNFSFNRRKIVHLYGDKVDVKDDAGNVIGQREADDIKNKWFIGQDPDRIWDYERLGVWQLDEKEEAGKYGLQPGDFKYRDKNEDGVLTDDDKTFQKYKTPRFRWTWRNELTFLKNFSFSCMMYSYWGHYDAFNYAANTQGFPDRNSDYERPRWTPSNPTNDYARIGSKNLGTYYRERSFIRLENVTLSYNVPAAFLKRLHIQNFRISAAVRNVAVFAPVWDYWDPERGWRFNTDADKRKWEEWDQSAPTPRSFDLSLNFTL